MIETYKKIDNNKEIKFTMPLSLRIKKECFENNIDFKGIHIIDLLSIIYSIRIKNAENYIEHKRQERMNKAGVKSINKASASDFDNL